MALGTKQQASERLIDLILEMVIENEALDNKPVGTRVINSTSDGTEITNTASINRGYKVGYNIIQTAGAKTNSTGGNGGHGMGGGQGGGYNSPGGGGSGYHDGSVTVVSSIPGHRRENAKLIIRLQT